MKKYSLINFLLIALLVITNILLFYTGKNARKLRIELDELLKENKNIIELAQLIEQLNQDNLQQSYQSVVVSDSIRNRFSDLIDSPKLWVRFDVNDCPPCVNSLKAFIKSLGKEIGENNIVLMPVYHNNKDFISLQREFKDFDVLDITSAQLDVKGADRTGEPYLFIYNKGSRYPLLFFYYRSEFADLNRRYKQSICSYFNNRSNK